MRSLAVILACAVMLLMGACSPPRSIASDRPANALPADTQFSLYNGRRLLGQALIDEQSGDKTKAYAGFQQAAEAWPGLTRAWRGLARTTTQPQERDAAEFIAARTSLLVSDDILTQREIAASLRTYLEEQRALPDANPVKQDYGFQLIAFYEDLYRARGEYDPPKRFGNIQPNEVPAALFTGVFTSIYAGTVLTGD